VSSNQKMWLVCETAVITSVLHFSHRYPRRIAPFCITIRFFSPGRTKHKSEKPIPKKNQSDIGFLRANSPSIISPLPHSGQFIFVGLVLGPVSSFSVEISHRNFFCLRLAVAPAKWKLEFKERRYRRLPRASCSLWILWLLE